MEDELDILFPDTDLPDEDAGHRFATATDDLLYVMRTETGRRFLHRLIKATSAESINFCGEIAQDSYIQGQRAVGVRLIDQVKEADFDLYLLMISENRHG